MHILMINGKIGGVLFFRIRHNAVRTHICVRCHIPRMVSLLAITDAFMRPYGWHPRFTGPVPNMRPLHGNCRLVPDLPMTGIVPDLITYLIQFMIAADHPVEIPRLPLKRIDKAGIAPLNEMLAAAIVTRAKTATIPPPRHSLLRN